MLLKYLRDVSKNDQFEILVLKILTEERRTAHCKLLNKAKHQQHLKVGDVVKSHIQVQSKE